jgi:hypothetical protein
MPTQTVDPTQIPDASQIPPAGALYLGLSSQGLVDIYCGTLPGDLDAAQAAKELLGTGLDTAGLSNADYIYRQTSALYGPGAELPDFRSPSGKNVKSLVFVSGSSQGAYGAFHFPGTQADFDRIVVDSLNTSGSYSAGSGLGFAIAPAARDIPRLFDAYRGPRDLLAITHSADPRLEDATNAEIRAAHLIAAHSVFALKAALEAGRLSVLAKGTLPQLPRGFSKAELARKLISANQEILGLVRAVVDATGGRQHLSTALFAAELVESFEALSGRSDPGKTDGEAVSRVVAFKLAPEISLVPGFNGAVIQQWWQDGHPDFVNVNSENDTSTDGNAAGVMFLEFLTDYLGISLDQVIQHMPTMAGAPLGQTYVNLLKDYPQLTQIAGQNGKSAFEKMIALLQQNAQPAAGTLNLPADGNPFPAMPGAKQGGLFAAGIANSPSSAVRDATAAIGLEAQLEQQLAALKSTLQQVQGDLSATLPASGLGIKTVRHTSNAGGEGDAFAYKPPLPAAVVANLEQRVARYRAPQYDQTLQQQFWPHVYNELPGTGPNRDRLQVITGTNQAPVTVQITGTITSTKLEPDGDLHIAFQPDDPSFPTNRGAGQSPLEIEIIYAGPVTQADAKQAQRGYTNPFDISHLGAGVRIQAAGPLIFDRAHGIVDSNGNVQTGLEIHPLAGTTIVSGPSPAPPPPAPTPAGGGQLSADLKSALSQSATASQTLVNLTALLQKMQQEVPQG